MSGFKYLKQLDKSQLWRLFVDGRFQKKYNGWVGYEAGERGSVSALLNGFSFMIDNYDISNGLKATYLRELHKVCMLSVATTNLKSSPGDIRYLNSGMPFFAKSTTYEHLVEVFALRKDDGTAIFNSAKWGKTANELNVDEVYQAMLKDGKINYRNWYPNIDKQQQLALEGKLSLHQFYEAKHSVQMLMVAKMEEIVERYNRNIQKAKNDEEKLRAIALVPRELELLHPFPDGNSRTFSCVTLTHLLTFNGFAPALLENPNLDNEVSLKQWIQEVKNGMQRTLSLIQNPTQKLFNYSILDMDPKDRETFTAMASNLIQKIDAHKEIFLTPSKLVEYTGGNWIVNEIHDTLRFSGVGTYGTYQKDNIYFTMSIKDWIKEQKDVRIELEKVLSKGIRAVVIDDLRYVEYFDIPILYVKDTFEAFKKCAIKVRQDHDPFTVLVTGTEGKTGAKVQFHHLLNRQVKTHAVLNSANTEVPVLRSLINLEPDDAIEINEVSVGSDEAYRVERAVMVNPNLCFFTNIGPNHMDMHKSIDNIMRAKSSVVEGLREGGKCILNSTIEYYGKLIDAINQRRQNIPMLTYGKDSGDHAILKTQSFDSKRFGWHVDAEVQGISLQYFVPFIQQHAPLASVGILLAIHEMGYDVKQAAQDYADIKPFETMGQVSFLKKRSGDIIFYDQSRRGGMHGMRSAFNDLNNFNVKGRVIALVGGISIKNDTEWTKESHTELAQMINNSPIDRLYTTGNFMHYVHKNLKNPEILVQHNDNIEELAKLLFSEIQGDDLLFIIGSAYLYLGRVSDLLYKMKDQTKFDTKIISYPLTPNQKNIYKALLSLQEIENGVPKEIALKNNEITMDEFIPIANYHQNATKLRGSILFTFFQTLDTYVCSFKNFQVVNQDIIDTGSVSYVYNELFCTQWFNNLDKKANMPNKQLFGSFYFFGNPHYLLHVEVATMNLHVGFVAYTKENDKIKVQKMNTQQQYKALESLQHLFATSYTLQSRSWGLQWVSFDYATLIDTTKADTFATLIDFNGSDLKTNLIEPILEGLVH